MSDDFAIALSNPRDSRPSSDQTALRAKKKAKSRANSDDEVFESFIFISFTYILTIPIIRKNLMLVQQQ